MISRLLLGYDGSDSSQRALEFALELAGKYEAKLHIVAVARPPEMGTEVETEAIVERGVRHYRDALARVEHELRAKSVPVECAVVVGHPAEQLVRYAEGHGIDHIVVGHRGHTRFERWLIGSIARQVMAYSSCNVTVVRA